MSLKLYKDQDELVTGIRQRDQAALNALYTNYGAALNGVIVRIVNDTRIAEEVLQDVLIKIWNKIEQYDGSKGRLFTWMMQISRNAAHDKLRSREISENQKTNSIEKVVGEVEDHNKVHSKIEDVGLKRILEALRPEERQVIELVYFKGYTQAEAAKEIPLPLGTVKTRLRMALINLRKILKTD